MGWTKEQQQAIELRGQNLLVSAAAGSGKTAVLVERIVRMVCEEQYDIDKILVVTFTKAAAAEMKERIGNRLLKESIRHPDDRRIQQQLSYLHRAPISTIHSFCTGLLRNHFHMIGLDPGFRIGEEGEVALLKEKVMDELLEDCYAEGTDDFLRFVEAYSYGRDDRVIARMILKLYEFSISHPAPEQWLKEALDSLEEGACASVQNAEQKKDPERGYLPEREPMHGVKGEDPENTIAGTPPRWLSGVMEYGDRILEDAIQCLERAMDLSREEPLLAEKYLPFLTEEKENIEALRRTSSYDERVEAFGSFGFRRIPAIRTKEPGVKQQQEAAKGLRDEAKTMLLSLKQDCFGISSEQIQEESRWLRPYVEVLVSVVLRFSERYLACKLEKNVLEFHDLEHFALQLLVAEYRDGQVRKTPLAEELSARYQAVFTDEYQDSNLIQEVLLKAVSREEDGNRFMVGDIKQSIYRFRMARPEIFLEKYALGEAGNGHCNVELRNNFRSRPEVLYGINHIFYQIMKPSLGDVLYEKKVALTPPDNREKEPPIPQELWILDLEKEEEEKGEWRDESKVELEAKMVAQRIHELEKDGNSFKDMVILLRTMEGWASVFEEVLTMEGIPVYTESRTGYFDTFEIRVLLNLLSVVDNIYQDIPMAAVLRSPIGGLTGEDLAAIRSLVLADRRREDSLYDEMNFYLERGAKEELKAKIRRILQLLTALREEKTRLSLPELIWSLLDKTDYYHLVGSMPNGEQRMANIRMFMEKAGEYEKTSFKGVFHFIQYMEQLKTYDIDYGEASILGEEADVVRIMSIHKSKGLEFPIVFLSGTGKMFNFMDRNQRMLLHPDYYIGLDCIDIQTRVKRPSVQKKMISRQLLLSMLGEELRVLYVGMTRARDKLIMTGTMDDFGKNMRRMDTAPSQQLTFSKMIKASCFLDWIFPAMLTDSCMDGFRQSYHIFMEEKEFFSMEGEPTSFQVQVVTAKQMLGREIASSYGKQRNREAFMQFLAQTGDLDREKEVADAFSWEYRNKNELKARSKWSVSQLKEETQEELLSPVNEYGGGEPADFAKEEHTGRKTAEEKLSEEARQEKRTIPSFRKEQEIRQTLTGASRGTAVHKMMEILSFVEAREKGMDAVVEELVQNGRFPEEYVSCLPIWAIRQFVASPLGSRLETAERGGNLYREAQFMIGVPMREMEPDIDSDELVLVQGVIDLYLEEEDGIVLLDYKTDYVEPGGEEELLERYAAQLSWYRRALEQMTGKPVKETILYSFGLSKALKLDK